MIYSFWDEGAGQLAEVELSMADAPAIGEIVEIGGRRLRRIPERDQQLDARYDEIFRCYQVSRRSPEAAECDFRDARGTPCFSNRSRAENWAKSLQDRGVDIGVNDE